MDAITASYIAGLMDGEGCFYVERFATQRSPLGFQYRIIATVTMCDKDTIEFVAAATNKKVRIRTIKSGRTAYTIDWRNSIAYEFIKAIHPYLRGKKEQASQCLYFNETLAPGRGKSYTSAMGDECERIRTTLQAMKRKDWSSLLISQSA